MINKKKIPEFVCRASAIGTIMTNPRSGAGLSETTKTYCEDWLKSKLYPTVKTFQSKYTDKGMSVEDNAIIYASQALNLGFTQKNTSRKQNEFISGECDIETTTAIHDIKSSWDCYTFPLFDTKLPEKNYFMQLQGYMWLWGKSEASVIYCLMDMPEDQLNKEAFYRYGRDVTKEQYDELKRQYTYSGLDDTLRVRQFKIEYQPETIEEIKERVQMCRAYIQTLIKNL